ncbi:hypothetical protein FK220_013490 [Flavobacteriaceae bacterium TP-CH-4]|uniref:DUF4440 domain-containing protein n=1 Tax=Pelagihabitans pacificus TaxID=2696054 RepID=A0A967E6C3_9FLAO|nr:hypothetical protein [Pelagihabitans pacificus]NHF60362.1 hypothetical protein [Pelagihabitans pacificus]
MPHQKRKITINVLIITKTLLFLSTFFIAHAFTKTVSAQDAPAAESIRQEILAHGDSIRKAFGDSDLHRIRLLHHPEVVKALGYNDVKNGREEVIKGISETLQNFRLDFVQNDVENIWIRDGIAIEQTRFSIQGTPRDGGEPFVFKGRTMVTYVRSKESPTGWATIREIIQPATE